MILDLDIFFATIILVAEPVGQNVQEDSARKS